MEILGVKRAAGDENRYFGAAPLKFEDQRDLFEGLVVASAINHKKFLGGWPISF